MDKKAQEALEFQNGPSVYFTQRYKKVHLKHAWLLANFNRIKHPYNQGDQDNTNLGEGVCYNNSLFRWRQIADNPTISNQEILLGSNNMTRFNQNTDAKFHQGFEGGKISAQELIQKRKGIYASFGLKASSKKKIQTSSQAQDLHEALAEAIEQESKAGRSQLLIELRVSPELGHAVTVECDAKNNVYRLIDDNLGLVEFESLEVMQKELVSYFKAFYPQYITYAFEIFDTI